MQLNRLPPTIPRPTLQRQGSLTPDQITEELRRLAYSRGVRVSSKLQTLVSMVADHQYPYKSSINTADVNRLWATLQDQARSLYHLND